MTKQKFTRIALVVIAFVTLLSIVLYFYYEGLKGEMFAMAGGILVVNLLVSIFLARKNMK